MEKRKNLHLLWRTGFGPNTSDWQDLDRLNTKQIWKEIQKKAHKPLPAIKPSDSLVKDNYGKNPDNTLSNKEKEEWNRKLRQQSVRDLREMNLQWIDYMVQNDNQLGEKMSFFWHNHFAIRNNNSFLQEDAINIIRKHALGNFGDMLREVSKSGAMIVSLNNQQNKKSSPNENFAREIMELFSMGIGTYSEKDIKEAARAFTGWNIDNDGNFVFRQRQHDDGIKHFLGREGRFDGDDIIDIILEQPQTANFIATKLYRNLVNEQVDEKRIKKLATSFHKNYNILVLVEDIVSSDWFYDDKNIGSRIKSPVELIVGARRFSPIQEVDDNLQLSIQRLLGQVLFYPPSIAGWPSDKNWIDNTTLMVRLQFPLLMNGVRQNNFKAKDDDDMNMGMNERRSEANADKRTGKRNLEWKKLAEDKKLDQLKEDILITSPTAERIDILAKAIAQKGTDSKAYGLMGLPEYQLC